MEVFTCIPNSRTPTSDASSKPYVLKVTRLIVSPRLLRFTASSAHHPSYSYSHRDTRPPKTRITLYNPILGLPSEPKWVWRVKIAPSAAFSHTLHLLGIALFRGRGLDLSLSSDLALSRFSQPTRHRHSFTWAIVSCVAVGWSSVYVFHVFYRP